MNKRRKYKWAIYEDRIISMLNDGVAIHEQINILSKEMNVLINQASYIKFLQKILSDEYYKYNCFKLLDKLNNEIIFLIKDKSIKEIYNILKRYKYLFMNGYFKDVPIEYFEEYIVCNKDISKMVKQSKNDKKETISIISEETKEEKKKTNKSSSGEIGISTPKENKVSLKSKDSELKASVWVDYVEDDDILYIKNALDNSFKELSALSHEKIMSQCYFIPSSPFDINEKRFFIANRNSLDSYELKEFAAKGLFKRYDLIGINNGIANIKLYRFIDGKYIYINGADLSNKRDDNKKNIIRGSKNFNKYD